MYIVYVRQSVSSDSWREVLTTDNVLDALEKTRIELTDGAHDVKIVRTM